MFYRQIQISRPSGKTYTLMQSVIAKLPWKTANYGAIEFLMWLYVGAKPQVTTASREQLVQRVSAEFAAIMVTDRFEWFEQICAPKTAEKAITRGSLSPNRASRVESYIAKKMSHTEQAAVRELRQSLGELRAADAEFMANIEFDVIAPT